ncbi:hypothetical protein QWA68_015524 [Fusarium oxysporum]|nr:hypothetical protein QWA68_015524 [Fusarium oxysporum]
MCTKINITAYPGNIINNEFANVENTSFHQSCHGRGPMGGSCATRSDVDKAVEHI